MNLPFALWIISAVVFAVPEGVVRAVVSVSELSDGAVAVVSVKAEVEVTEDSDGVVCAVVAEVEDVTTVGVLGSWQAPRTADIIISDKAAAIPLNLRMRQLLQIIHVSPY